LEIGQSGAGARRVQHGAAVVPSPDVVEQIVLGSAVMALPKGVASNAFRSGRRSAWLNGRDVEHTCPARMSATVTGTCESVDLRRHRCHGGSVGFPARALIANRSRTLVMGALFVIADWVSANDRRRSDL
jgi:hypothetical protein